MSGLARQFWLMKEKSRCSILFHLLVPGGRWQTMMSRPSWLARFWSSRFHSRTREPLLPPPSAVISAFALGLAMGVSACTDPYDPGQRAVGGGLLGASTGAAIGHRREAAA